MKELLEVWDIETGEAEEEIIGFEDFSIRLLRPSEPDELIPLTDQEQEPSIVLDCIPDLAKPLPVKPQRPPLLVTHLLESLEEKEV